VKPCSVLVPKINALVVDPHRARAEYRTSSIPPSKGPYSRKTTNPTSALTKVVAATIDTAAADAGESVGGATVTGGTTGEAVGANEKVGANEMVGDALIVGETLAVGAKVPFMAEGAILGPIAGGSNSPAMR